ADPGAPPRRDRAARVRPNATAPDDPPGRGRDVKEMTGAVGWAEAITLNAAVPRTARRLIPRLERLEAEALAFCRLLEGWARGSAVPATAAARASALQAAAERVAEALLELEGPLERYLLELQPEHAEGGTWFGEPGPAELVDWKPV